MNQLLLTSQFSAGNELLEAISEELITWQKEDKVHRLWASDTTLWTNDDESQWTGWLRIVDAEFQEISRIEALASEIKSAGFTHVALLGMGGSSLCPAMLAQIFNPVLQNLNYPELSILDSTDPQQIMHFEQHLDLKKTLFIVSSKSGSTLEPNIFYDYFKHRLQIALGHSEVGQHFIAITDPGTKLETLAQQQKFKSIFHGEPSIGGRYSALSNFGIVPAALMGLDIKIFLKAALEMAEVCKISEPQNNPGVVLGVILGICAKHKKDKITFIISPEIVALGAWLEQLLAESTGKMGKGLIPVDLEPVGKPEVYSNDRVFVYIRLETDTNIQQESAVAAIEEMGFVVIRLHLAEKLHLSAELFRWEIATATAGSIIGINPFNQPDVEESKTRTKQLMAEYEQSGKIPQPQPFFSEGNIQLFSDENNIQALQQLVTEPRDIKNYLKAHLNRINKGDYFDLAAFIEMSDEHLGLLQQIRTSIRDAKKIATCLGFGPRFLHSTGQAYKGGPNTGVFLQITADHPQDISVPDHHYTFGTVINAQAQGDFEVLTRRSRRALRIHLGPSTRSGLEKLLQWIKYALNGGSHEG